MTKKDDYTMEISAGGKTVTCTSEQFHDAAKAIITDGITDLVKQGTLVAFGLLNREYICKVMKVAVPRHEDKNTGYVEQSVDMLFALQVLPRDLEYNGLLSAAYEYDKEAGCYRAAPGDLVKLSSKDKDFIIEIAYVSSEDEDTETEWRILPSSYLILNGIVPDADKETAAPGAEVLILARRLPHHLAGELWYPNFYTLRFKERQMALPFGQGGDAEADTSAEAGDTGEDEGGEDE